MENDAFSKCHPAVNFLFFIGAIGFGVVIQHPLYLLASCICGAVYYLLLRRRAGLNMILGLIPAFLILSGINPLFANYGQQVLFTVFGKPYALEALYYGMAIAGIFVVMMLWFGCYSIVLTSDKFVCLFGSLIPSLSLLLVMVLRMIPNLVRKGRQIIGVRKSIGKGAGPDATKKEKLTSGLTMLSALTDWSLEGSIITADSMRSRGYGAAKRTSFQIYRMTMGDVLLTLLILSLSAAVIFAGGTQAEYTPEITIATPGWGLAAYWLFLLIPTLLHLKEALQWHISISKI